MLANIKLAPAETIQKIANISRKKNCIRDTLNILSDEDNERVGLFGQKKNRFMQCWPILGIFWCPVVNLVPFSSNL